MSRTIERATAHRIHRRVEAIYRPVRPVHPLTPWLEFWAAGRGMTLNEALATFGQLLAARQGW